MRDKISIVLIVTVLVSVTGFSLPCTLHCLSMDMDMDKGSHREMCDHEAKSGAECDGSCMVKSVSDKDDDNMESSFPDDALLTHYRVNLLATDTNSEGQLVNPFSFKTYFNIVPLSNHSSWISDPLVPPPKQSLV